MIIVSYTGEPIVNFFAQKKSVSIEKNKSAEGEVEENCQLVYSGSLFS